MTPDDLRSIREDLLDLGIGEFADLLGVHRRTVFCWETGRTEIPVPVSLLLRLAEADPMARQWLLDSAH